jgi:succinate-semialdehyde dehydrogenase / glutarate-semialdehyde dehydrogenase
VPPDVNDAASRARIGQQRWEKHSFSHRARIIRRFHDLVLGERDAILDTIQSETGKARRDALAEIASVAGTARYYLANGADHLSVKRRGAAFPVLTSAEVVYKPHGLVGLITPWNYPFLLSIADALPALLAGNAVLVKPSELTPFSANLARELLIKSGLEPDLLQMIHGGAEIGTELIRHVDYVGFTGGTETGRKVAVQAAERLIPFSLELGGKNPMVILEGASLEDAATGLVVGAFANSGQSCISIERVYVQESIYEEFTRRFAEKASSIKIGWSRSWDVDVGSMISAAHARKVLHRIEGAVDSGARIVAGGKARADLGPAFIEPTILAGVSDTMPLSRQETFGPVVALYPVKDVDEAIRRANDSEFGLNASVWVGKHERARAVARQIEAGSVGINSTLLIYSTLDVPMGGIRLSGIGRRHGEQGILRYTQAQSIVSSVSAGGGYDSMLMRMNSEGRVKALIGALKVWRRLG